MSENGIIKPRIGVLFTTGAWFRDVGLQQEDTHTTAEVDREADRITERLKTFLHPVRSKVVYSAEDAEQAARTLLGAEVDGILLLPLMWCEDAIVRAALQHLKGLPLILWTYSPNASLPEYLPFQTMLQGSGVVGTFQLSGMLQREGVEYHPIAGHVEDPEVFAQIRALAQGMAIRRLLRSLCVGVLPFRCDQMSATYVDEFGLRARYGIELKYLELEQMRKLAAGVEEREISAFQEQLQEGGIEVTVDERNLSAGIRYSLALEKLMRAAGVDVLAMNDIIVEMHDCFGLRPCLWNRALSSRGAVIAMEADIAAVIAMYILRLATGNSPFYTEPVSVDWEHGQVLMGHAGYQDAANADPDAPIKIVGDVEYENSDRYTGASTYFKYRPGPVTLINAVWKTQGLCWTCILGASLPGPPKVQGICHLVFSPEVPVRSFVLRAVEKGLSQHWIVLPGRVQEEMRALCRMIGISFTAITD